MRYSVDETAYYPGCTLRYGASELEKAFLYICEVTDSHLDELTRWSCCGTVFSLQQDALIYHIASVRNLIRAKEMGKRAIVAPCSICYNTIKQVLTFLENDGEALDKMNRFMYEEETELRIGDVDVIDIVCFLRDSIGYDRIESAKVRSLSGLKVAVYYGCLHSRPRSAATVDVEAPSTLESLLSRLGADCVNYSMKNECCGSYLRLQSPEVVVERTRRIIRSAVLKGAELILTLCPLCHHNLDRLQRRLTERRSDFKPIPIIYLTQLIALAVGAPKTLYDPSSHTIQATKTLEKVLS